MKFGLGSDEKTHKNRQTFLGGAGLSADHTTLVKVTYDTDNFRRYRIVETNEKSLGMAPGSNVNLADAVAIDRTGHALFLPLADCIGAVLYDPEHSVIMVSHLGRHSAEVDGGRRSVDYLVDHFQTDPSSLLVWLSPAVGGAAYPLDKFDGRSMHEVIVEQMQTAGVVSGNIEVSHIDTAHDPNYFSHSQFLRDPSQPNGRFAIVAMMIEQGEPAA